VGRDSFRGRADQARISKGPLGRNGAKTG
jgi:hypothetical protein